MGPDLIIVTPGIRPTGTGTDDHARRPPRLRPLRPVPTIWWSADPSETHKIRRLRRQRFWPKCRQPSIAGLDSKPREFSFARSSPEVHHTIVGRGRLRLFFAVCYDARSLRHWVWWV